MTSIIITKDYENVIKKLVVCMCVCHRKYRTLHPPAYPRFRKSRAI